MKTLKEGKANEKALKTASNLIERKK